MEKDNVLHFKTSHVAQAVQDLQLSRRHSGKSDATISVRVSLDLKEDMQRRATALGMTLSAFAVDLFELQRYGLEHVLSVEETRRRAVMGLCSTSQTNVTQMADSSTDLDAAKSKRDRLFGAELGESGLRSAA